MRFIEKLKYDLPASLVVFLIALPLSLGIALASGAPIKSGLIAAVVGGIVVGFLGGAPFQVSGPAAGLSVMVLGFISKFGFETTLFITILGGGMQILLGGLGVGQLTLAISPSVIEAMLAGIGILIALGQTYVLLGSTPRGSALQNLAGLPETLLHPNVQAVLLGLLTLAILYLWNRFSSNRLKFLPGSLVAVVLGTFVAQAFALEVPRVTLDQHIFESFSLPHLPSENLLSIFFAALALTIVASAESLLCAVATDKLHSGPRAKLNKELMGQGVANVISGILGGLPITGVIVRSSANIRTGAQTRASGIMHGIWILLFSTFMAQYLTYIPLCVLAGLLIYTGVNLVKLHEIKKLMAFNEVIVYFVTLSGVVFINLLWGIGIGFALALVRLIFKMSRFHLKVEPLDEGHLRVFLSGSLTFLGIPSLVRQLDLLPKGKIIQLVLEIDHLDHASLEAIRAWKEGYEKAGGKINKTSLEQLWKDLGGGSGAPIGRVSAANQA